MEYSEEQVIKMMKAYANFVRGLETLKVRNDMREHEKTGEGFKYLYLAENMARVGLEIFEEDVPDELREKLDIKKNELEKELER